MVETKQWKEVKGPLSISLGITALVWLLLFVVVILDPTGHHAGSNELDQAASSTQTLPVTGNAQGPLQGAKGAVKSSGYTPERPRTVPFDFSYAKGSDDLPLDRPPLAKIASEVEPEQIHIALAGEGAMYISWATGNASVVEGLPRIVSRHTLASVVVYGNESGWYDGVASGEATAYVQTYPDFSYISGTFHHVRLTGLQPNASYYFKCGDPGVAMSRELRFATPQPPGPAAFPQRIGVIADLGQTHNSSATLQHLIQSQPPVVLLVGDLTYADNYFTNGTLRPPMTPPKAYQETYQPRWDAWGRFVEPLVPMMVVEGNHEVEADSAGKSFQAYNARYRVPHAESGSDSPLYYSFDLAGSHILMLGAYADWGEGSEQYRWLVADLAAYNRSRTPWLIATFHAPWYNTYIAHYKELECMRIALEPLLYEHGVDIIFAGHVHAYERCNRVYNYTVDPCGPIHVTIGDGGNIEKLYTDWVDQPPSNCPLPGTAACPTLQEGSFCPAQQPPWSAYREPSFGHGILELASTTEATWTWHKNQDSVAVASDTVKIRRNLQCTNQQERRR
ncbi:Metallo-dependent phosphatase [Coccomyxa subellipsoidea C-169]|uniref:Purple acid phosphatase n=1 Tax=Coccomyxa subellipsoidea (strain C-169) TaxID=574566 RepID=I0YIJ7_COCSC|nr:Metallo-dependent phosphatase [Coccomyxa subellipsoidea C-169]EIE18216.1 Metallo-dependent phosphatase [Coccomyxa subellipsoidea C-169]|eukprot:XP_005642760.1 Metallo-dependent phosphatase [Coccomyxa subellipsoidea C-169]